MVDCYEEPHMLSNKRGPYGFYPMRLGQTLMDGKFEVIRKLGYGKWASVWLAKERMNDGTRYVAIKVLSTNATTAEIVKKLHEVEICMRIMSNSRLASEAEHPGQRYSASPLRVFKETSRHGTHYCIVLPLCGTSLVNFMGEQPVYRLPHPVMKRVTQQVLLSLTFLHDVQKVVHCDVKAGNVVVKLRATQGEIDSFLRDNPAQSYEPQLYPELSADPIITVKSQPLPPLGVSPSMDNLSIRLVDYGSAFPVEKITSDALLTTPPAILPPEMLLGHPWSFPVDIWAVGCMLVHGLTGANLFIDSDIERYSQEMHLVRIAELLGAFPADFLQRCSSREQLFDRLAQSLRETGPSLETWLTSFDWVRREMSSQDIAAIARFLRRCFTIDPQRRPTASELLQDEWFRS
ncbi:kinase-like protein [Trametes sanguinea]|nr:kinase-like protein [Trametes sanguinea]